MNRFACLLALLLSLPIAAAGQGSRVDSLAEDYWQAQLDRYPERATLNGIPGERNARLTDLRPEAYTEYERRLRELLRAAATVDRGALDRAAEVNLQLLQEFLSRDLSVAACRNELWSVDQQNGPQVALADLVARQPLGTVEQRELARRRWGAMGRYLDQLTANLQRGLDSGYVAPRIVVQRVLGQLDALLLQTPDQSPFFPPALRAPRPADRRDAAAFRALVRDSVLPGFRRYRAYLRVRYLPRSRTEPGVSSIPGGVACYRALIRAHTSLDLSAGVIHAMGEMEVDSIRQEMLVIARRRFHTQNLDSMFRALRTDPRYSFRTRQEVLAAAVSATARMQRKLPELFGRLPQRGLVVERMPAYQERDAPAAYYFPGPGEDKSQPGKFLVNTYLPSSRPRFTAEVLAFHEGVPGHHVQVALAQELPLPDFRRYGGGTTAFEEGWALYTERLADEAGMYSSDLDRLGMLVFQSWRASRLVIDTGIHALGWSRQLAIDYLLAHTALSRQDVESEVDRYIVWPGQALGYAIGRREIVRLRREAEDSLGSRFDLSGFHDQVLNDGAVTLPILQDKIHRWIGVMSAAPQ